MNSAGYIVLLLLGSVVLAPALITKFWVVVAAFGVTHGFPALGALPQLAVAAASMGALTARKAAGWFVVPLSFCFLDFVGLGQPALLLELLRPVLGKAGKIGVAIVLVDRDAS